MGASLLLWIVHFLVLRGVQTAAGINLVATLAKLIPLGAFILLAVIAFRLETFRLDFSGLALGFDISDRAVKRAGLDYWHLVEVSTYENLADLFEQHPEAAADCWLATTKAPQDYCEAEFHDGCWLFFGKETAGLPEDFRLAHYERCIRLPMRAEARSLNLSNSVAILTYEALKQLGFPGLKGTGEMAEQPD